MAVAFSQRLTRAWRVLVGQQPAARRSFSGAQVSRLTSTWSGYSASVNSDLDAALVILRSRARDLAQNHEYGRRFLSLVANNIVGPCGPKLQVRATQDNNPTKLDTVANSLVETHWEKWCCKADIRGQAALAQLLRMAAKAVARDGETLCRFVRNRNLPYGIQLQFLEADRINETINKVLPNGVVIRLGVETDATGRVVALWLRTKHPGDAYNGGALDTERVDARDLLHLYLPERFEQVRGFSWFHAVLMRSKMLQGYEEAAIVAARVGAAKMGAFVKKDMGAPDALSNIADAVDDNNNLQINGEAGEFFKLPPGYELQNWDPDYPHAQYEAFVNQCLRGVASGLDVASHNLSGNMNDVTYSSARIAELSERDAWMALQDWFIENGCMRIFSEWLSSALIMGAITFPSGNALPATKLSKFVEAACFQGRRWKWVDPLKEVGAEIEAINAKLKSRTQSIAEQGGDIEDTWAEITAEQEAAKAAGIKLEPVAPKVSGTVDTSASASDTNAAGNNGGNGKARNTDPQSRMELHAHVHLDKALPPIHVDARSTVNVPKAEPPVVQVDARHTTTVQPAEVRVEAPQVRVDAPSVEVVVPPEAIAVAVEATVNQKATRTTTTKRDAQGRPDTLETRPIED